MESSPDQNGLIPLSGKHARTESIVQRLDHMFPGKCGGKFSVGVRGQSRGHIRVCARESSTESQRARIRKSVRAIAGRI